MPKVDTILRLLVLSGTAFLPLLNHAAPPTLAVVVQAGYERYPQRPVSAALRRQGEAIRQQAASLLAGDPAVMLRHENDAYTDDNGFRQWEGGLDLPLWLPGQRHSRSQVAQATDSEADGLQQLQRWRVAGDMRELLWSLRIAATSLELADQAVVSAQVLEQDVEQRYRAGELARTDLILAQKEALQRRSERLSAASQQRTLRQQYTAWTGLAELPAAIDEPATTQPGIGDNHPALGAARLSASRARAQRDQVRTEKRANPVLTLGSKTERPESGLSYDTALVVAVNVPLGSRSQSAVKTAEAELSLSEASAELAQVRRDLEDELIRTREERRQTAQALQLAQQQHALASEGLRLTQRGFELGESDLFTLLQARAQALASERDLRLRRLELGRAVARYNQALGVIPE
jgi:cobalt-zinc-cadmium efflux system outer membrane protein